MSDTKDEFLKDEFVEKQPIEAPPLKDVSDESEIQDEVDREINKQLGVEQPKADKQQDEFSQDQQNAYNISQADIYYQQVSEMMDNLFKLAAELLGDKKFENTAAENEVLTRIIYRYTGGIRGQALDSLQFVLVVFSKLIRCRDTIQKFRRGNKKEKTPA